MEIKPATMHAANAYDSFADDKKEELPPVDIEPFGDEQGTEVKYRVMKWWQCGMCMSYRDKLVEWILNLLSDDSRQYLPGDFIPAIRRRDPGRSPDVHVFSEGIYSLTGLAFASIFIATLVTMIATGVQRPARAHIEIITDTTFDKAFLAVTDIIIAYGKPTALHTLPSFISRVVDTSMYVVSAVVIYCSVGPGVSSPALSSAGPVMKKVAYGLAIPTVVFAGVIVGHVACKYIYVRLFRGSPHMHNNGLLSVGAWVGIALGLWTIAWIIAESIPVFNDILGFMSALFGSSFSYGFPAIFWLFMNKGNFFGSPRTAALTIINLAILAMACAICGLGLYVSGKSIHKNSKTSSWTCANNAA
ncbi:hypothetical protein ETB97_005312 [Aspergillus alliaceus]|uniref:Amino acid transporter transmembrane domain-containing protein n=1 Tax=Petromyces alliaceus TaxID=209559 RepID=A0A8H6ADL7_PETAA|nr:hypothetical protein ETB97_005312 [Aspergillus burnettii]